MTTADVPGYTLDDLYAMRGRMSRIHNLNEQEPAMSTKTPHLVTYKPYRGAPPRTMVGIRTETCWFGIDTDSGEYLVLDPRRFAGGPAYAVDNEPLSTDVDRNRLATLEQLTEGAILIEDTDWAKDRFAADRVESLDGAIASTLRLRAQINERDHEVKAKQEKADARLAAAAEALGDLVSQGGAVRRTLADRPDLVDALIGKAEDQ